MVLGGLPSGANGGGRQTCLSEDDRLWALDAPFSRALLTLVDPSVVGSGLPHWSRPPMHTERVSVMIMFACLSAPAFVSSCVQALASPRVLFAPVSNPTCISTSVAAR